MARRSQNEGKTGEFRRFLRAPIMVASLFTASLFIVPTVGNALAAKFQQVAAPDSRPVSLAARGGIGSFTPASVDPRLVAQLRAVGHGKLLRFTPAGSETRPDRAVTVAIRVDGQGAEGFTVRGNLASVIGAPGLAALRIAPAAYSLGAARGYQSFAAAAPGIGAGTGTVSLPRIERLDAPDLRSFTPAGANAAVNPGRLAPRIQLDEKDRTGRAPRTLENQGDYQVDLGGSYRLARNFNVTAGIRYSSERDRLRPLTDGKQDSQAVYVGTQFRF